MFMFINKEMECFSPKWMGVSKFCYSLLSEMDTMDTTSTIKAKAHSRCYPTANTNRNSQKRKFYGTVKLFCSLV